MPKPPLCPVLLKYTYDTAKDARRSLARVRISRAERTAERRRRYETDYFRCPYCLKFHLTHVARRRGSGHRTRKDYQ